MQLYMKVFIQPTSRRWNVTQARYNMDTLKEASLPEENGAKKIAQLCAGVSGVGQCTKPLALIDKRSGAT